MSLIQHFATWLFPYTDVQSKTMKNLSPMPILREVLWFFCIAAKQNHHWQRTHMNIHHSPLNVCSNDSLDNPVIQKNYKG